MVGRRRRVLGRLLWVLEGGYNLGALIDCVTGHVGILAQCNILAICRKSRKPPLAEIILNWIPAFAGMTMGWGTWLKCYGTMSFLEINDEN